jgi:hypothetical protein
LNYLAKSVEKKFSKPHPDGSESAKITFCDVTKVKNVDKIGLLFRKWTKDVHLNIFGMVDQNPPWKG